MDSIVDQNEFVVETMATHTEYLETASMNLLWRVQCC